MIEIFLIHRLIAIHQSGVIKATTKKYIL